jgi:2-polyprenyl-3-methyl-5-hydroxy-6-metoxy-1,4-benzoquinol methylase
MQSQSKISDMNKKPDGYYSLSRLEMLKFVPANVKRLLDVGCGEGSFGTMIKKERGAEVWGIEINQRSAKIASEKIDKVLNSDVSMAIQALPNDYFDCVTFNDVLEHLVNPYEVLVAIKPKLRQDGCVVCSLPNFRSFFSLRDFLLSKDWKYEDEGIFDKTHLRFFTLISIKRMFTSLDYEIQELEGLDEIKSWKFKILNFLSMGYLDDTKYFQYACRVKPRKI